jgi:pimeloyl-ACP methyl ester carboxylesterase
VGVTADAPAEVFGNSSGAIIALDLVARHSELVRTVVAHEPPVFELLDDRDHWRTVMRSVEETFLASGPWAALETMNAGFAADAAAGDGPETGAEPPSGESDAEQPPGPDAGTDVETVARMQENFAFFVGYEVPPFAAYRPDLPALAAAPTRVVPAVGEGSNGEPWVRAAVALAERLGTEAVAFPGDHGGFGTEHQQFAAKLDKILRGAA